MWPAHPRRGSHRRREEQRQACNDHAVPDAPTRSRVPRTVALHGFTQTGRSWHRLADAAARAGDVVIAPDLPGHGDAAHERPVDLVEAAAFVAARVESSLGGRSARWIGYSLGGRVLLHLALARPDLVSDLVLVSTTAGIDDASERAERRRADNALADRIEQIGTVAFVDEWMVQPLFASLPSDGDDVADRRRNDSIGLASSLRTCGTGTQEPLWSRLADLVMPTLIVTGDRDDKFTALGRRLAAAMNNAIHCELADAGHACHLEQPEQLASLVGWGPTA